jgi:hypothetical protein
VERHGLSALAMTRVVFSTMKEVKALEFSYCHCEEGAAVTDAAIHRVSRESRRECGSFTEGQWIATGYALAMTRVEETVF